MFLIVIDELVGLQCITFQPSCAPHIRQTWSDRSLLRYKCFSSGITMEQHSDMIPFIIFYDG